MSVISRALIAAVLWFVLSTGALATPRDPMDIPLKQYGFLLAVAIAGGFISWIAKVRKGEASATNVMNLIGELSTSAFAGLLAFWACEYMELQGAITAALVGISGHMGTRAIAWAEARAQRHFGGTDGPQDPTH